MYCPNCGLEQISEEMRFCQRCGLSLTDVKNFITGGALLAQTAEAKKVERSRGQRSARRGAWMILVSLALAFITALLTALEEELAILFLPLVPLFLTGLAFMLYGVFLADRKTEKAKRAVLLAPVQLGSAARNPELYAARAQPVETFRLQRVQTAEMVHPPSVTENTTRLLEEESQPRRK